MPLSPVVATLYQTHHSTFKALTTVLTDTQWEILRPLIPENKPGGRPRQVDIREVMNTLLYQDRTGCQ